MVDGGAGRSVDQGNGDPNQCQGEQNEVLQVALHQSVGLGTGNGLRDGQLERKAL